MMQRVTTIVFTRSRQSGVYSVWSNMQRLKHGGEGDRELDLRTANGDGSATTAASVKYSDGDVYTSRLAQCICVTVVMC